jgi:putative flavoprotein involved in K+ transport
MTGVRNGCPALEDGRILEVSNVVWCTGFTPNYDWIYLTLPTHNGLPLHDRGIIESCPGLYFVGLPFLYSLSSALLGGVGRDAEHVVEHLASAQRIREKQ